MADLTYVEAFSGAQLELSEATIKTLEVRDRTAVYRAVSNIGRASFTGVLVFRRRLPDTLSGRLLAPGARPGVRLRVEALRPSGFSGAWPRETAVTDASGAFELDLPAGDLPDSGLEVQVSGGGGESLTIAVPRGDLIGGGEVGVLEMPRILPPLPRSVWGTLATFVPSSPDEIDAEPDAWADLQPGILLGEGDCASRIDPDGLAFDQFSFGMLFRLVDPEIWPKILRINLFGRERLISMRQVRNLPSRLRDQLLEQGEVVFADREPITRPIDVDDFADQIARSPVDFPKAGTLGIGYVLGMRQSWEPTGFSLGDLIYSLPLAPGEVQRVAVRERRETLAAYDRESLSVRERRAFDEAVTSSASSVFSSALRESGAGESQWSQESSSGNLGGGFSLLGFSFGGGGGWSSAEGGSSGWSTASRNFVSSATQRFSGAVARQSAAARQAARTSMRLASSTDTEETTTRVIANNNRLHALTVQYWEVLRHFSVTTRPDDVMLVCFVPLQLIQWKPADVPIRLDYSVESAPSVAALRRRYAMIWRYADRIWREMPRRSYVRGMRQLRRLMTTPDIGVQVQAGQAQTRLDITINGSFLPFDTITVDAIDRAGRRVGRANLGPDGSTPDFGEALDRPALLSAMRRYRSAFWSSIFNTRSGSMVLRRGVDLSRVERFDIRTRITSYTHTPDVEKLKVTDLGFLNIDMNITIDDSDPENLARKFGIRPFNVGAGALRREVGGPILRSLTIAPANASDPPSENLVQLAQVRGTVLPPWLPLTAKPVAPTLTDEQLVEIERLFQHVVMNGVHYSRAVWSGLDADERATMLEAYTIGVPPDSEAPADVSQEIPLLNCVSNRLMGFFGNSMVLPFHLPPELERVQDANGETRTFTTRDLQESLLQFHREGFQPAKMSVTVPTNGHLAEAVLGNCAAGEKIDHTRFWNWQDGAPGDVRGITLPGQPGSDLVGDGGAETPGVTPGLLAPAIGGGFVPSAPQSPEAILASALGADVSWLKKGLEDVRGMESLTALLAAALGQGDKPGVDVASVNAINKAVAAAAKEKGFKLSDLTASINDEAEAVKKAADGAKAKVAASTEAAKAKADAAAKERAAKIDTLIARAPAFAALVEGADPAARAGLAEGIAKEFLGASPSLSNEEKARLYLAYAPKTGDAAANETGKAALRTAMKLD